MAGSLAANAVLFVLPHGGRTGALGYTAALFLFYAEDDSWAPMRSALEYLERGEQRPLYAGLFFERGVKFQYPPTSLLFVEPFIRLRYGGPRYVVLNGLSFVAVLATVALSILLFEHWAPEPSSTFDRWLRAGALAVLGLTFYPLTRAFLLGQIQTWIDVGVAALLLAWCAGRHALAGAIAGLVCMIKPHYGLVFAWAALRRRWSMLTAGVITAAAVTAISIARYGLVHHVDYLATIQYLARVGESYYANQSVNGLVSRMLFIGNNLKWRANEFPPFHPAVYAVTAVASLALLGAALLRRGGGEERSDVTDLMIMLVSITMASSIAWEHHYGILLPMFALATPLAMRPRPCGRWTLVVLVAAYELVSLRLSITNELAGTPLNFLQSYVLAGAALFLILLYRLRARETCPVSLAPSQR